MADTLMDSEVLGIWKRIKFYVDIDGIKSTDKMNQKEQLASAMENPKNSSAEFPNNMDTLIISGFPSEFVENPSIRKELLEGRISSFTVRGVQRFRIVKGTPSFTSPSGKRIRAGQFLKGTSERIAIDDLFKKSGT